MADTHTRTDTQLLAFLPDTVGKERSADLSRRGSPSYQQQRDILTTLRGHDYASQSRVLGAMTGGVFSDGSSTSTTAYHVDYTLFDVAVGETAGRIAAGTDAKFIGSTPDIETYDSDGTASEVLSADGKTKWVVFVVIDVNGTPELRGVAGAEADDGQEVKPTDAAIRTALDAAAISNVNDLAFVKVHEVLIQRVATDTITPTFTAVTTAAQLRARSRGVAWNAVS